MTKNNLRITAKRHAHLLDKTPAKFQKDPAQTVGAAFTTSGFVTDSQTPGRTDRRMDARG